MEKFGQTKLEDNFEEASKNEQGGFLPQSHVNIYWLYLLSITVGLFKSLCKYINISFVFIYHIQGGLPSIKTSPRFVGKMQRATIYYEMQF